MQHNPATFGTNGQAKEISYPARDVNGTLVAYHVRQDLPDGSKRFLWKQPDKQWGLKGRKVADVPLFGAHRLDEHPHEDVIVVEGEKAQEVLESHGLLSVATMTGASNTPSIDVLKCLSGHVVTMWPDNDQIGRDHMHNIGRGLDRLGIDAHVLKWPTAPEKGDAADFFALGGTVEELEALLATATPVEPISAQSNQSTSDGVPLDSLSRFLACTDLGNARRYSEQHGGQVRFVPAWKKWLVWDGKRWAIDDTGYVIQLAKETVRKILGEAADDTDSERRIELAKWAIASQSEPRIRAMLELAKSEPGIPARPVDFDTDPWLLNVLNGTIDLRASTLRPHRRDDLITKLAPVHFDPNAACPNFERFLLQIMDNRPDLFAFLKRAIGYSLTGSTVEQMLLILHGDGANGKSTFLELFRDALGDYASHTPTDTLTAKRSDGIPNDVARLRGARFVTAVESEDGRRLAESLVKQLTGGDKITARFLYGEFFEFTPTFKFWLATNHKPAIRGTDHAMWRRIRLIPFGVTIPDAEQDKHLPAKLREELPGVVAWAVRGCLDWQHHGLGLPEAVQSATDAYRDEMDVFSTWLADCCIVNPQARETAKALHESYSSWCDKNGEKPIDRRNFSKRLLEKGFEGYNGHANVKMWRGLGFPNDGYLPVEEFQDSQRTDLDGLLIENHDFRDSSADSGSMVINGYQENGKSLAHEHTENFPEIDYQTNQTNQSGKTPVVVITNLDVATVEQGSRP